MARGRSRFLRRGKAPGCKAIRAQRISHFLGDKREKFPSAPGVPEQKGISCNPERRKDCKAPLSQEVWIIFSFHLGADGDRG